MISTRLSEGKKPPLDTNVIVKLRELKSLIPLIFRREKIKKLKIQYNINILSKLFLTFSSDLKLLSPE